MSVSVKVIRRRIKHSTLAQEKQPDSTVDVLLSADQAQPATDQSTDQPLLVARVENEIQFLPEELAHRDAIMLIMTAEAMRAIHCTTPAG